MNRRSFCLAGASLAAAPLSTCRVALARPPGKTLPLRVVSSRGPCQVRIEAPAAEAHWNYRIPEGLSCDEGVFKSHAYPLVEWQGPEDDGTLWHAWETNDADFLRINDAARAKRFQLTFIQGIRYRVAITPEGDGLSLRFTAMNVGRKRLHNLVAFPCLGHPSKNFHDMKLQRTFITTERGLTALSDTDRGANRIRTHYRVRGCHAMKYCGEPFWGKASRTLATGGAILRTRDDGRFTVGTMWERMCEIFQNEDSHHCLHSVPSLGDLKPGQQRTVRGRIVLVAGDAQAALDKLRFA